MAFTEDFTEFFDTNDFAVLATYTPDGGSASTVKGIYDNAYELTDGGDLGVSGSTPVFHCTTSDVPLAAPGDMLNVNSIDYEIVEVMPDGTGTTILRLRDTT